MEEGLHKAVIAFNGDVYDGLSARTLDKRGAGLGAGSPARILSRRLYGVLRPLDAIQPYRLEMGTRLKAKRGARACTTFWGARICRDTEPRR